MPFLLKSIVLGAVLILLTACSEDGSKVFGEQSSPCAPTVLTNDVDDREKAQAGSDCFFGEVNAGRAVVWDVLIPTVEGDPIPTRYEFTSGVTVITEDSTRDTYGQGFVRVQRCQDVQPTNWLPEGVDCEGIDGDGFQSDSLPALFR